MITQVDLTYGRIDINIDLEEADAILRALYAGEHLVSKGQRTAVENLRRALFDFKYPKEVTP